MAAVPLLRAALQPALLAALLWLLLAQPAAARALLGQEVGDTGGGSAAAAADPASSKQAYASLLYGDSFLLGLRVLGQSLRETGTTRDLVALVTKDVSLASEKTLRLDGWKVRRVDIVENPGLWTQNAKQKFPPRFYGVYTKLLIFNLTDYERVVYLDADATAVHNMDELFLCDGLCGVMRHSERINTGVLVLTPSTDLFNGMMRKITTLPSYDGGDQGIINSFFSDWPESPLFDPRKGQQLSEISSWRSSAKDATGMPLGRLPTLYNADLGLFIMNSNRWTLPPQEIRVLHYTLATFKPWDWWSGWIMGATSAQWQAVRARLPAAADGRTGGRTASQKRAVAIMLPLPLLVAALLVRRYLWLAGLGGYARCSLGRLRRGGAANGARGRQPQHTPRGSGSSSPEGSCGKADMQALLMDSAAAGSYNLAVPAWLTAASATAGVAAVLTAVGTSTMVLIPRQIVPTMGWVLAYEWTAVSFVVLYSLFLHTCHWRGRGGSANARSASSFLLATLAGQQASNGQAGGPPPTAPAACSGMGRPWGTSLALFATILTALGLIPWWANIVGIQSFVGKVLFTVFMGVVSVIMCTQCFISLAARWYQCGAAEAAAARPPTDACSTWSTTRFT